MGGTVCREQEPEAFWGRGQHAEQGPRALLPSGRTWGRAGVGGAVFLARTLCWPVPWGLVQGHPGGCPLGASAPNPCLTQENGAEEGARPAAWRHHRSLGRRLLVGGGSQAGLPGGSEGWPLCVRDTSVWASFPGGPGRASEGPQTQLAWGVREAARRSGFRAEADGWTAASWGPARPGLGSTTVAGGRF